MESRSHDGTSTVHRDFAGAYGYSCADCLTAIQSSSDLAGKPCPYCGSERFEFVEVTVTLISEGE